LVGKVTIEKIWNRGGAYYGNSLLHEVQKQGGDKKPQANYTQKRQTSGSGYLLCLWHKGVPDRQTLDAHNSLLATLAVPTMAMPNHST
jgi:hypothetical protein